MTIDIERLKAVYSDDVDDKSDAATAWTMIPDSKTDKMIVGAMGSSGGTPNNGWKIHISIDPAQMGEAAVIIAELLNKEDAPRVSLKFAGKQLAPTGQAAKQVAFIFYVEELENRLKIANFLSSVEQELSSHGIGIDSRPINSDPEDTKTKYDASILMEEGIPGRFNYRNENCVVMDDDTYHGINAKGNFQKQDAMVYVKQSYFMGLPNEQKHNPGNCHKDPFANLNNKHATLSISEELFNDIETQITRLRKEINSSWPYPNKDRKQQKMDGLTALLDKLKTTDIQMAVTEIEEQYPDIRKGDVSTRTNDLLDRVLGEDNSPKYN